MYSCYKLARGNAGGIIKCGTASSSAKMYFQKDNNIHPIHNRFDIYEFRNHHQYSVIEETDLNRPTGKLYISTQADTVEQKHSRLIKKLTPRKSKGTK